MFGWKIHDRISEDIEENIKTSIGQNLSNKEKTALRNLIKAKNNDMICNNTDKNMGTTDADKKDVISECIRQTTGRH